MITAEHIDNLQREFAALITSTWIHVEVASQRLRLLQQDKVVVDYPVSTATRGVGCEQDSYKTPYGAHRIARCIGAGRASGEIFVARSPIGKIASIKQQAVSADEDLILSRILWLKGLQRGINQGAGVDSYERYIYIHGTQDEGLLGTLASHGCVRMANQDVIDLFEHVTVGTFVYIAA